jgi:hypothetical protein
MVTEPKKLASMSGTLEALQDIAAALSEASSAFTRLTDQVRLAERWLSKAPSEPQEREIDKPRAAPSFSMDAETRTHVPTSTAAAWLNRSPQTLRKWACYENGPLRPVRINGRLAWPTIEIRRVMKLYEHV